MTDDKADKVLIETRDHSRMKKAHLCPHLNHEVIIKDVSVIREREISDGISLPSEFRRK
jgi:hypothetical protein